MFLRLSRYQSKQNKLGRASRAARSDMASSDPTKTVVDRSFQVLRKNFWFFTPRRVSEGQTREDLKSEALSSLAHASGCDHPENRDFRGKFQDFFRYFSSDGGRL
jgi:hypothetical protein